MLFVPKTSHRKIKHEYKCTVCDLLQGHLSVYQMGDHILPQENFGRCIYNAVTVV